MTLFTAARWRGPVPNQGGAQGRILGLVLHIQQGTEAGTDAWLHNPASKVSAHFGNPKVGGLDQWVEVGTVAWAEVNGNYNWVSLENEGNSGDQLTASQLENAAQLLAWLHTGFGVPLQLSDSTVPGLTGHGLGGNAWGGHFDCPGQPILDQRPAIITRAAAILGGASTTGGTDMTPAESKQLAEIHQSAVDFANWQFFSPGGREQVQGTHAWRMQSTLDNTNAIKATLEQLLARPVVQPVDVAALAAAIGPVVNSGATADEVATAVVAHLAEQLVKP